MAQLRCSFCGKPQNEVRALIPSGKDPGDPSICDQCVDVCKQALVEERKREAATKGDAPLKTPREIKTHLDQYVIGQHSAKKDISNAVYKHYQRRQILLQNKGKLTVDVDGALEEVEIDKSNILLMGPTGTGKTHIARSIARMLNVPFYVCDATKLTQAGYVGDDVESMLQGLIADADGNLELAEWGIIMIDEIDKLARKSGRNASGYRDVTGEGVQQALLKMIEGSKMQIPRGMGKQIVAGMGGSDCIDTTNILFICAGSFAGIEEDVMTRLNKGSRMGFGGSERKRYGDLDKSSIYSQITEDDVLEFGMIPELVGRLPVITSTLDLTEEEMIQVLTKPRNSIMKQFRATFGMNNIDLQFEGEATRAVALEAKRHPTGARALRSIMENVLKEYSFDAPSDPTIKAIRVTKECVEGKAKAVIVKRDVKATA